MTTSTEAANTIATATPSVIAVWWRPDTEDIAFVLRPGWDPIDLAAVRAAMSGRAWGWWDDGDPISGCDESPPVRIWPR